MTKRSLAMRHHSTIWPMMHGHRLTILIAILITLVTILVTVKTRIPAALHATIVVMGQSI